MVFTSGTKLWKGDYVYLNETEGKVYPISEKELNHPPMMANGNYEEWDAIQYVITPESRFMVEK